MPETFDLDRAFEALAHDVMDRTSPPSAVRAIKQARRRRRTAIATVALAAAVVVGGVAVPTLLDDSTGIGFADALPDPAPLDPDALNEATEGWITGWSDEVGSGWSEPKCFGSRAASGPPDPVERGMSRLSGYDESTAFPEFLTYGDTSSADEAWQALNTPLIDCPESVTETDAPSYPAGTEVRHYTVQYSTDGSLSAAVTDVWVARTGNTVGSLDVRTRAGVAGPAAIDAVSDALVAGLLDGWSQTVQGPEATPEAELRPQLPYADERILKSALAGWRSAERADGKSLPRTPCLESFSPGGLRSYSASATGQYLDVAGYEQSDGQAERELRSTLETLRGCYAALTETSLPGGVTLFTYDLGGDDGHGAVWLAHNEDRAIMVALDGAASPMPAGVDAAVGTFMTDVLALPWPEAS